MVLRRFEPIFPKQAGDLGTDLRTSKVPFYRSPGPSDLYENTAASGYFPEENGNKSAFLIVARGVRLLPRLRQAVCPRVLFVLICPYFYGNPSTEESSDGGVLSNPFADIFCRYLGRCWLKGSADLTEEAPKD